MFCTQLSYVYIWLLRFVTVVGLCAAVPLGAQLNAEMYFVLRRNTELDRSLLVEPLFSEKPYCMSVKEGFADERRRNISFRIWTLRSCAAGAEDLLTI